MPPPSENEFAEVASYIGYAVLQTQILEQVLGFYHVMVHKISIDTARTEVETMFVRTEKRTLGQLFRALSRPKRNNPHSSAGDKHAFFCKAHAAIMSR
jgi:hypothetical protein